MDRLDHVKTQLNALREQGVKPRVHGNGFIQLDITERVRLHVWGHPGIPRQKVQTPIHNHVFGFTSECLLGRMLNVVYALGRSDGASYRVFEPETRQGEDTILVDSGHETKATPIRVEQTVRGFPCTYALHPYVYHETLTPEPAITLITKSGPTVAQGATQRPGVLVPVGVEPDNDFDRYKAARPEYLWRIINEVLDTRG